ncbi:MAG: haloalkane dehalogenase [Promethearchaeota archaeon]
MIVRTPEERFENLPDFPYEPHHVEVNGLRMHHVDVGKGKETFVLLHGEPTWSFLYRKMIPKLSEAGRVVAPDFVGFGRSDKFTRREDYTVEMHCAQLAGLFEKLKLREVTLVVHDWGGIIGLSVAARHPEWFRRLVVLNTFLPTGDEPKTEAFLAWRSMVEKKELVASRSVQNGTRTALPDDVLAAYDAPFPDASYKAGIQAFPLMVPMSPTDPGAGFIKQTIELLKAWHKPTLVAFAPQDPILGAAAGFFKKLVPGARNYKKVNVWKALHFLQEDKGEELAEKIVEFVDASPA